MSVKLGVVVDRFPALSETFVARELAELRRRGFDIYVYALRRGDELARELAEELLAQTTFRRGGAAWATARGLGIFLGDREARKLARLFARGDGLSRPAAALRRLADVRQFARAMRAAGVQRVYAHFLGATAAVGYGCARLLRLPLALAVHAGKSLFTLPRPPSALERAIASYADAIVACANVAREELVRNRGYPADKVHLIYHGVDADELRAAVAQARARLAPASAGPPAIVAVGRLVPKKGFHTLIAACLLLAQRGVRFRCRIVGPAGDRRYAARLAQLAREAEGAVELVGPVPWGRMAEEYARAAVLAAPSEVAPDGDRDGLPNVVLEAAACGLPIVATNVGGLPEFVREGDTGFLIPAGDPRALADALRRLLEDEALRRRLGEAAEARVRAEFLREAAAAKLAPLLGAA